MTRHGPSSAKFPMRLIGGLLLQKAACFALIFLSIALLPHIFNMRAHEGNFHRSPTFVASPSQFFQTWDAQMYLALSESGYRSGEPSVRFFPLWPLAIRLCAPLTRGSHVVAGLLLANALSILALTLLHAYLRTETDGRTAGATLMLMLAFPGAMFFLLPYSEAMCFLFSVVAWALLRSDRVASPPAGDGRRLLWVGVAVFAAALTRPTGVFWSLPLAVYCLRRRRWAALPVAGIPILGFAGYLAVVYAFTGDPFEGIASRHPFVSRQSLSLLYDLPAFARSLVRPLAVHGFVDSAIDRVWFLCLLALLPAIYRRSPEWFASTVGMGILPAMALNFMSYTRYALMAFPCFAVVADWLARPRREALFAVVLSLLFGLQLLFIVRHINFYWAG